MSDIISGNIPQLLKLLLMSGNRTWLDLWKRTTVFIDLTCGNDVECNDGAGVGLFLFFKY